MQYLVSVIDDKVDPGSTDRMPQIDAFNDKLIAEGYWVFAGGLADTDAATVKAHLTSVLTKLGATNRTQVALLVHDAEGS